MRGAYNYNLFGLINLYVIQYQNTNLKNQWYIDLAVKPCKYIYVYIHKAKSNDKVPKPHVTTLLNNLSNKSRCDETSIK